MASIEYRHAKEKGPDGKSQDRKRRRYTGEPLWRVRAIFRQGPKEDHQWSAWIPVEKKGTVPEELKQWIRDRETELREKRLGVEPPKAEATIGELIEQYLASGALDALRNEDVRSKRALHLEWWKEQFGKLQPSALDRAEVTDRLKARDTNPSAATRNRWRTSLSAVFRWAIREGRMNAANPLAGSKEIERPEVGKRYRLRDKVDLLRAAKAEAERDGGEDRLYPAVALALTTGMRRGEVWNLRVGDIDFAGGWVRITEGKTAQSRRVVPLRSSVAPLLRTLVPEGATSSDYVFQRQGASVWPRDPWNRVLKESGLLRAYKKHFHNLRHTFASEAIDNGVLAQHVAQLLGHGLTYITERYTHGSEEATKALFGTEPEEQPRTLRERLPDLPEH